MQLENKETNEENVVKEKTIEEPKEYLDITNSITIKTGDIKEVMSSFKNMIK